MLFAQSVSCIIELLRYLDDITIPAITTCFTQITYVKKLASSAVIPEVPQASPTVGPCFT